MMKKREKILVPNFVHTRPGQENFEKYIKKIQKIIKPFPAIIFSQNGNEIGRKREKKKFLPQILFILDPSKKIPKKILKKVEKL